VKIKGKIRVRFDLVIKGKDLEGSKKNKRRGSISLWNYDLISCLSALESQVFVNVISPRVTPRLQMGVSLVTYKSGFNE
jgi:hypothetical protein